MKFRYLGLFKQNTMEDIQMLIHWNHRKDLLESRYHRNMNIRDMFIYWKKIDMKKIYQGFESLW
jgi:hypothetical protein